MALTLKQEMRLSQQLVMTPQLQQAIKLLQLSRLELVDAVQEQMMENPVLMDESDPSSSPDPDARVDDRGMASDAGAGSNAESMAEAGRLSGEGVEAGLTQPDTHKDHSDEIDWENYLDSYSYTPTGLNMHERDDDMPPMEANLTKSASLADHLVWQLHLSRFTESEEYLGMLIIHNLDGDGYLKDTSLEELAEEAGMPMDAAEKVLLRIQEFDPLGVAARDLRDCLLIQARVLFPEDTMLQELILNHIGALERKNYAQIARELKLPLEEVIELAKIVSEMDPKPGSIYDGESPMYITPDIYVHKISGEWVTVLNEDGMPKLKVSNYYREALSKKKEMAEAREYIQDKLRSAVWLIRSIHQRQQTILRVTTSIVKFQEEFLDKGIAYLKPLILRDVAMDIGMHESTISRVTTNKYVHTPQGTFELKYFFNSGIGRFEGEDIASESVKNKIKAIISEENPSQPYSDQKIAELLASHDIDIARRTVAKYREMMGILPSSKRKRVF